MPTAVSTLFQKKCWDGTSSPAALGPHLQTELPLKLVYIYIAAKCSSQGRVTWKKLVHLSLVFPEQLSRSQTHVKRFPANVRVRVTQYLGNQRR